MDRTRLLEAKGKLEGILKKLEQSRLIPREDEPALYFFDVECRDLDETLPIDGFQQLGIKGTDFILLKTPFSDDCIDTMKLMVEDIDDYQNIDNLPEPEDEYEKILLVDEINMEKAIRAMEEREVGVGRRKTGNPLAPEKIALFKLRSALRREAREEKDALEKGAEGERIHMGYYHARLHEMKESRKRDEREMEEERIRLDKEMKEHYANLRTPEGDPLFVIDMPLMNKGDALTEGHPLPSPMKDDEPPLPRPAPIEYEWDGQFTLPEQPPPIVFPLVYSKDMLDLVIASIEKHLPGHGPFYYMFGMDGVRSDVVKAKMSDEAFPDSFLWWPINCALLQDPKEDLYLNCCRGNVPELEAGFFDQYEVDKRIRSNWDIDKPQYIDGKALFREKIPRDYNGRFPLSVYFNMRRAKPSYIPQHLVNMVHIKLCCSSKKAMKTSAMVAWTPDAFPTVKEYCESRKLFEVKK